MADQSNPLKVMCALAIRQAFDQVIVPDLAAAGTEARDRLESHHRHHENDRGWRPRRCACHHDGIDGHAGGAGPDRSGKPVRSGAEPRRHRRAEGRAASRHLHGRRFQADAAPCPFGRLLAGRRQRYPFQNGAGPARNCRRHQSEGNRHSGRLHRRKAGHRRSRYRRAADQRTDDGAGCGDRRAFSRGRAEGVAAGGSSVYRHTEPRAARSSFSMRSNRTRAIEAYRSTGLDLVPR